MSPRPQRKPLSERETRERHFVEEMGLMFEELGSTRMVGRILGRLLICDPAHQSSAELAEDLMVSRASISTSTRQLLQMGMIVKHPVPGDRNTYFRVPPDAFENHMMRDMARVGLFTDLCRRGLSLLEDEPPEHRARLQELHDLYAFMEKEMPLLLEKWLARKRGAASPASPES